MRKTGLAAITLREDDELIEVKFTDGKQEIILLPSTASVSGSVKKTYARPEEHPWVSVELI